MSIDLSPMFPEYERAEGDVRGELIAVRLHQGGSFSTISLRVDKIANCLDEIRREQGRIAEAVRAA
jgi:hypothetical protein